jgi:PBP1b-binding outer membrane lipoprotein LpoB
MESRRLVWPGRTVISLGALALLLGGCSSGSDGWRGVNGTGESGIHAETSAE